MKQNRRHRNISTYKVCLFSIRMPRMHNEGKDSPFHKYVGKTIYLYVKE
jgi:hypothetical protein